ncbi:pyridoxal-phosphate dependent enzyme [Cupriavidus oxalaticus]|uniref:pyridoxal-phosphate dependent enzyme n=1 Tax=Cupriavidus oxalaticus TaxID=96344 RepID=UPI004034A1AE
MHINSDVRGMWRYADLFSAADLDASRSITLGEGDTPVHEAPRTAANIGCHRILIKDESQNPSGSFKDRSGAYTVLKMREQGAKGIVLQSTGNAAASFAIYAARAGLPCHVVVPDDVLPMNVHQIIRSGAMLTQLSDWTQADATCAQIAKATGFHVVSAANTPHRMYAKQSLGFEIVEQCDGDMPDAIFCPTGGGIAVLALRQALGRLCGDRGMPRLYISQYAGCCPIVDAFNAGVDHVSPCPTADTPRGGMRTPFPRRGADVLQAISSGGAFSVSPAAAALQAGNCGKQDGINVGLECGTALASAAIALIVGDLPRTSTIMVVNTAGISKMDPRYL